MMDAGEHYALSELRHLISEPFNGNRAGPFQQQHLYALLQLGGDAEEQIDEVVLSPPSNTAAESPPIQPAPPPQFRELREEGDGGFSAPGFGGCSQGRWPRQETLTLLEIRSRLDSKFKEAAEKAPIWEEVSRIMADEHGYQRSGKKCREKLENLYKYYKKTKEGKAGRHDGKHYRFFRQLEALYGDGSTNPMADSNNATDYPIFNVIAPLGQEPLHLANKLSETFSLSNSSGSDSWSSEDVGHGSKRARRKRSWRVKMKEFVDQQLERFMTIQEAWLERMLATLETKEKERITIEEERRKREAASLAEEHRFWARERAWMEARDSALIEALERLSGWTPITLSPSPDDVHGIDCGNDQDSRRWPDREVTCLVQLRTAMEERFQGACSKNGLWEEISAKMGSSGYSRSAKRCKEKWENINKYFRKTRKCSKRRKESSRTCQYYKHLDSLYAGQGSEQSCAENRSEEAAVVGSSLDGPADHVNEERYVPFLVDGSSNLWEGNILEGGPCRR
ncbi:duplicated homeodomain-like superfamily protein [Wolffia australiana]